MFLARQALIKKKISRIPRRNFYQKALDETERPDVDAAAGVDGVDDEIALLRVKLKALLENDSRNLPAILQTTGMLARLINIRHTLSGDRHPNIEKKVMRMLNEFALPLGIAPVTKKP